MLNRLIASRGFVKTVEVLPPRSAEPGAGHGSADLAPYAEELRNVASHFDGIQIAEQGGRSRRRFGSVAAAVALKRATPTLELAPTLSSMGRSRESLEESIRSTMRAGVDNIILVWGDRPPGEPAQRTTSEVPRVSELISLARAAQSEMDVRDLCILAPINLPRLGDPKYLETVRGRERATADVFLSQPYVGEPESYLLLLDRLRSEGVRTPVLHDVFPLLSREDAVRMSQRWGFGVPRKALEELRESGRAAGLRRARAFLEALESDSRRVDGVYISSRGEPELALGLVR